MFTILPTIYFLGFIFPFPHYVNLNCCFICNKAQFLCNIIFLMWLLLPMPHPLVWPFILRDLVYLYQLVDPVQVLCAGLIDSGGTMLDGGSLAPHSSQHVGRHSSAVAHHKRSSHRCLSRPGAQGSAISAFNPLAAQQCVLCRWEFSSSVCQTVAGATQAFMSKVHQQCWKEWAGWCAQQGVPNNAISAPKLGHFLVHLF